MGPECHFQGCRTPAADVPWHHEGPGHAPVPLCRLHQERFRALMASGGHSVGEMVIDVLTDGAGHRRITVRPPRRRERTSVRRPQLV